MSKNDGWRKYFFLGEWEAIIIFLVGLALTFFISYKSYKNSKLDARYDFELVCKEVKTKIVSRLQAYANLLRLGAAYYSESDTVTRENWRNFFDKSKIDKNLPGIQGYGLSIIIPKDHLAKHIKKIQQEGYPQYTIKPQGERDIYTSIIYLEPFKDRNLRAFGYDMFSEKVRRKAMENARDYDLACLSGKVTLIQETNKDVQAGTLMYVPIYKRNKPINTIAERRKSLRGWVYSPYRMSNLMNGILGRWDVNDNSRVRLKIYDGILLVPEALLFDSQNNLKQKDIFQIVERIEFNGTIWTLVFSKSESQLFSINNKIAIIFISGFLISFLLFLLSRSLINTKIRAQRIAEQLIVDLKKSEAKSTAILNALPDMMFIQDLKGVYLDFYIPKNIICNNPRRVFIGQKIENVLPEPIVKEFLNLFQKAIDTSELQVFEYSLNLPDCHRFFESRSIALEKGKILSIVRDITHQKEASRILDQTRENYETFFNTIDDFLFVLDANGNIIHTNNTVKNRLGYNENELLQQSVLMIHPEDRRAEAALIVKKMIEGKEEHCPIPVETKDGQLIPVETRISQGFWDGVPAIFGVTKDITKIKISEEKFSKAFHNNANIMAISAYESGEFFEVNQKFLDSFNLKREEVIGKTTFQLNIFSSKTRESIKQEIEKGKKISNLEIAFEIGEKTIYGLFSADVIFVQDKKCWLTVMQNISDLKQAEQTIINSLNLQKALLDNISAGVAIIDIESHLIEQINLTGCKMFGDERENIVGISCMKFLCNGLYGNCQDINLDADLDMMESILIRKDQNIIPIFKTVKKIVINGKAKLIETFIDISPLKQAEEELRQSNQKLEAIISASPDGVGVASLDGKITLISDKLVEMYGYDLKEKSNLLGKNFIDFIDPSNHGILKDNIQKLLSNSKDHTINEYLAIRKDNSRFYIDINSSILYDTYGIPSSILVVQRDITERKKAIDTLKKNEIHLLLAFNLARMGHWEYDVENDLFYFNDSFYNIFDNTAENVGSYTLRSKEYAARFVYPDDIPIVANEIAKAKETNDPNYNRYLEHRFLYSDKRVGHLAVRFQITKDENGKTIRLIGVNQDITKQKNTEESIRLRESYMLAIIENQPGLIWLKDREGKFLAVNELFVKATGLNKKDQIIGKTDWDVWPHELAATYIHEDKKLIDSKKPVMIEELISEEGIVKWFETFKTPIFGEDNSVIGSAGFSRDITERKKAEEEIKQISTRLSLAAMAGGVGVWDWDIVNNILIWDDQMYFLYGIKRTDFSGAYEAWLNGLHPDDKERGNHEIQLALKGEKEFDTEFRVVWPDKTVHNIRALAIVQRDGSGKPLQMVGTNWDITEQKNIEAALIKSKLEAEMANRAKSEFLANMSHEIRTPMNAILGFSEALYHKLNTREHQKMVKSILNGGNLLMSLLNDILDLSKIEAGKLEISPGPVHLPNLLREIILLFEEKAKTKDLELVNIIPPDFPSGVILDEIRIKQVLFNLIGNAIKFTKNGYVKVQMDFQPTRENLGKLIIHVEDSGIGIPKDQQTVIFEAFRQQSGQSNREYGGTGLGLAISKRLVEKMNGYIELESKEGIGSTFSVIFPEIENCQIKKRENGESENEQNIEFEKSSILVIDDVYSNIEAIENLLSESNITVFTAEDGELGLEVLKHKIPDLILLDMRMPGIDGYEVAQRIKNNAKLQHIPILAYTASVMSSRKIEDSGIFDAYLYKPVRRSELFQQLKRFLKYKVLTHQKQSISAGAADDFLHGLPSEENLRKIIPILKERFLPEWIKIKDTLVLFKINEFAQELYLFGSSSNFTYLMNYADRLKEYIEIIDIEAIEKEISEFPNIIERLQKLV